MHKETTQSLRKKPDKWIRAVGPHKVQTNKIPDYFTPEFAELLDVWATTKEFGLPFSGNWAEQPCRLMDVMKAFNRIYNEWQNSKMEKSRGNS